MLTWECFMMNSITLTAELQVPLQALNAYVAKQLMMQLIHLNLGSNRLVGSLPETWSRLSNVSPLDGASTTVHATVVLQHSSQLHRLLKHELDTATLLSCLPRWPTSTNDLC